MNARLTAWAVNGPMAAAYGMTPGVEVQATTRDAYGQVEAHELLVSSDPQADDWADDDDNLDWDQADEVLRPLGYRRAEPWVRSGVSWAAGVERIEVVQR